MNFVCLIHESAVYAPPYPKHIHGHPDLMDGLSSPPLPNSRAGRPFFRPFNSRGDRVIHLTPLKEYFIARRGSMNYADMNIPISPPLLDYSPRWSWEQLSPRVWDLGKQNCMAPVEIPTILWSSISRRMTETIGCVSKYPDPG